MSSVRSLIAVAALLLSANSAWKDKSLTSTNKGASPASDDLKSLNWKNLKNIYQNNGPQEHLKSLNNLNKSSSKGAPLMGGNAGGTSLLEEEMKVTIHQNHLANAVPLSDFARCLLCCTNLLSAHSRDHA